MRDAIVYGYDWKGGSGAVERISQALARVGSTVLHCEPPTSALNKPGYHLRQIEPNLFAFKPWVLASRLNRFPGMRSLQSAMIVRQILDHVRTLQLRDPVFLYIGLGPLLHPLCKAMRKQGRPLVHVTADYVENLSPLHVGHSDLTLVFSRTAAQRMRARWGEKIHQIEHGVDLRPFRNLRHCPEHPPAMLAGIPRPRLGYAGEFRDDLLNTRLIRELLERRPDWSFVSFQWGPAISGMIPAVPLLNARALPWQGPEEFVRCVAAFDIGFMPYDCSNVVMFNNPPMKLWDYFALGMPVVATPLIHLWEYEGLVYLGETTKELEFAVEKALAEPRESPLRARRMGLAEEHAVEVQGRILERILG